MTGVDVTALGQYGAVGVFLVALFYFAIGAIKRERERTDRCEAQLLEANNALREYAVSATKAIDAIRDIADTHRELIPLLQEVRRILDRLDRG